MRIRHSSSFLVYGCIVILAVFVMDNWCPLENIIGIPCPGCNMFTALYWLLYRGDITYANYYHPMVTPFLIYIILCALLFVRYKAAFLDHKIFKIITAVFIVLLIGVYLYRMIIVFPNSPMIFNEDSWMNRLFHLI